MVYAKGVLKEFVLWAGKMSIVVVVLVLLAWVMGADFFEEYSSDRCEEAAIDYESKHFDSDNIPSGESFVVHEGKEGLKRICKDSSDEGESEEIVEEPVDEISVSGSGELPPDAEAIHTDIDYIDAWNDETKDFNRNFTDEAYTHYCESIELDDDYTEDWEEYCADR